jgi:glycerol kinase
LCDALRRRGVEPLVRRRTGLVLDPYFSGTKIRWLLDHVPGARRRAAAGRLAFGTVDAWLLWRLSGGRVHATDYTNASRTLLFNIATRQWDRDLLRLFGVPSSLLPSAHPSAHRFGQTSRIGPLPAGIPIAGIAGDQQAALFGHGCTTPGSAKNTYGTGCFLLLHTGGRRVASRHGLVTTIACGARGEPAYALEGSVFIAGAAVQWLRDGLRIIARADETEALARRVPDTGGVYLVPAFVGLGAPYWDAGARGAIVGLTRGTGREAIARACLESIAYQTADVVGAMERDSGVRLRELRVDGGATQNGLLMQFQADVLGVPVARPASVEYTARGAALLAGMTVGLWSGLGMLARWDAAPRRFRPRVAASVRRRWCDGWREAVRRVRTVGR